MMTPTGEAVSDNLWEVPDEISTLAVFRGSTYDEHVDAWKAAHAVVQRQQWQLAAIAVSLERSVGGRPRTEHTRQQTLIQRFCCDVGIDRQKFHRLSHTYRVFAETRTTSVTSYIPELSFKHFEVAARLAKEDPAAAIIEAHDKRWSANQLQQQLEARKGTPPFSLPEAIAQLREAIGRHIAAWPEDARGAAPEVLRDLADDLDARVLPPLTLAETHALGWIKADLENIPFVKHTFNEAGAGRGGDLEVVPGAAGAPIYHTIIGEVSTASRSRVLHALDHLLAGKVTPTGHLVLGVARDLASGNQAVVRQMVLPPDAGREVADTLWTLQPEADDLPHCLREMVVPDFSDPIGQHDVEAA